MNSSPPPLVAPATPARAPTRSLSRGRTGVTLLLVVGGIIATGFATAFQWLLAAVTVVAVIAFVVQLWQRRSVVAWIAGGLVVTMALGALYFVIDVMPAVRRQSHFLSVATYQIRAARDQYLLENPDTLFITYDDLIGPNSYMKGVNPTKGEDYRTMFPLRCDIDVFAITFPDKWEVIVGPMGRIVRDPKGGFPRRHNPNPEIVAEYQRWVESQRKPDGVHRIQIPKDSLFRGATFEVTYQNGVPHGPFRAYDLEGNLWADAVYQHGRPVGRHRMYRNGRVISEKSLGP